MIRTNTMDETDWEAELKLNRAFGGIVADLAAMVPGTTSVPTIMVAANESAVNTVDIALALGDVADERGLRVLLVESSRRLSVLAGAGDLDGTPALVDIFGAVRIVLPAEGAKGLFLAPSFKRGQGIAAALARNAQAEIVDDIAAEFDIVIIDGCRATDSAAAGWSADAYLRVGRFTSQRDTDLFCRTLDVSAGAFVGTVAATTFVPAERDRGTRLSIVPHAAVHAQSGPGVNPSQVPPRLVVNRQPGRPAYPRRTAIR